MIDKQPSISETPNFPVKGAWGCGLLVVIFFLIIPLCILLEARHFFDSSRDTVIFVVFFILILGGAIKLLFSDDYAFRKYLDYEPVKLNDPDKKSTLQEESEVGKIDFGEWPKKYSYSLQYSPLLKKHNLQKEAQKLMFTITNSEDYKSALIELLYNAGEVRLKDNLKDSKEDKKEVIKEKPELSREEIYRKEQLEYIPQKDSILAEQPFRRKEAVRQTVKNLKLEVYEKKQKGEITERELEERIKELELYEENALKKIDLRN